MHTTILTRSLTHASCRGASCTRTRPHKARAKANCVVLAAIADSQATPTVLAAPNAKVLVAGASGGVGQLVVAKLAERGYQVRAMTRSPQTPNSLQGNDEVEVVQGDCRNGPSSLMSLLQGVDAVCCCTGTTAFPSSRWKGDNGPEQTDFVGVRNLIQACPKSLRRFVLVSSAGVERQGQFPYIILNAFGVLKWKRKGEMELEQSGLPYTILRPGRLTDGPYTSYDLNTLTKATSGNRTAVQVAKQEKLDGETSRLAVAEAVVQCLLLTSAVNQKYSLISTEGDGPGTDPSAWKALLT